LHARTRRLGLSLGEPSAAPVPTTDRAWERTDLGIEIELVR